MHALVGRCVSSSVRVMWELAGFSRLLAAHSALYVRARDTTHTTAERGRYYSDQIAATAVVGRANAQQPELQTMLPQATGLLPSIPGLLSVCLCAKAAQLLRGILERPLVCFDVVRVCARTGVFTGFPGTLPELSMPEFMIPPWWKLVGRSKPYPE